MEEHPAEEQLELFALRRLPEKEMWAVLRHVETCSVCRTALQAENEFIVALRAALEGEARRGG